MQVFLASAMYYNKDTYISNSAHYTEVLSRVLHVKHSLWIGIADIKLYIEDKKLMRLASMEYGFS